MSLGVARLDEILTIDLYTKGCIARISGFPAAVDSFTDNYRLNGGLGRERNSNLDKPNWDAEFMINVYLRSFGAKIESWPSHATPITNTNGSRGNSDKHAQSNTLYNRPQQI